MNEEKDQVTTEQTQEEATPQVEHSAPEIPAEEPTVSGETVDDVFISANHEEKDDEWWIDGDDYSKSERTKMEAMYAGTLREFNENEIIEGTVTSMGEKEVVMNIGFKSEGIVQISEFRDTPDLKPGDSLEVYIEKIEDQNGQLLLSRRRAKHLRSWERINDSMDKDTILTGHIMRRTKGGFVVDIDGIEAFLPGSQIDVKPVRDFDVYVGRDMEFKVVKINHAYENVVVSHKILIEAKLEEQRKQILQNLEKGQVLEGTVKNMTNFGVFIDLGGVDGLLHITDISWGRINHPEEVLNLDEKVNVVVLDFDDAKKRISLGMKQLTPHPWDSLPETISEGSVVKGKIVTVADYGVFLEIMSGVEGLIHTSEMSWSQHSKNTGEQFSVGDELDAMVLNIDHEERKMSLGLKQLKEDPWDAITTKYPVGSQHTGRVRNMTNYGLFVELEEGVDGLVHISDLSWTKKFNHPSEFIKDDENLDVVVLDIDVENRRLSLGHKQLTEDVWDKYTEIFSVGSTVSGTIRKIDTKGAVVELEYGIEANVPAKHLKTAEGQEDLKAEDTAEFVVIDFNKEAKRLVLSHSRIWQEPTDEPAPKPKKKKSKPSSGKAAQAGSTTLGELDVLAKLKQQMEAEEKKGVSTTKSKAKAKKAEEPKAEEPKAEEPKAEEPKAEVAKAEEPKAEEAKAEEPKAEVAKAEEPKAEEAPAEEVPSKEETPEEAPFDSDDSANADEKK